MADDGEKAVFTDDNAAADFSNTEKTDGAGDKLVHSMSSHTVGKDSPYEVGFHLCSAVDNAFILAYPLLIMVFTGWIGGSLLFFFGWVITFYANNLLGNLAIIDGVRYIRFRDISEAAYGKVGFWVTVVLQWMNLLCGNIGLMIIAGQALQGLYRLYNDTESIQLTAWIFIACGIAICCTLLIYDLHQLRYLSIVSAFCIFCFATIAIGISAYDGANADGPRDYGFFPDEVMASKVFNFMGAFGSVAFAFTSVIMPEIQATVRDPPVENFRISLVILYFCGAPLFIIMSMVAYWAYGNEVKYNVLDSLSGPVWAKTVAWVAVFIQVIVSLQIYAFPIYEAIDTKFGREGGPWKPYNIVVRVLFRGPYIALTSFVAALLPFFGDFVALIGAMSVLPLAYCLTFLLHVHFNKDKMSLLVKVGHWLLSVLFAILTLLASIAAVRYIVVDSITYSVFANL